VDEYVPVSPNINLYQWDSRSLQSTVIMPRIMTPWPRVWRLEVLPKVLSLMHKRAVFAACHIRYILLL
jgi:hypothetical protein